MQSVGWGDNSGVVSLLYFCGRPIFDWQKGGRTFANSNGIGRPSFRHVSASGIMISLWAVRGWYRYAGTAFVTAQQLRSMLGLLGGRSGVSRMSKGQYSWRALEGGGAATDWGWFIRVYQ
jgi:hypothetical protein